MEKRGKKRVWSLERGRPERRHVTVARMHPERYFETLLRKLARQINFVLSLAPRHFEAKRFCLDLEALVSGLRAAPPRRA